MSNTPNYTFLHIESLKSEKGGWSKASLKSIGVSWPPKRGWKKKMIDKDSLNPENLKPLVIPIEFFY